MINPKYKDLYISSSKSQIKELSSLVLQLEKNPSDRNLIENIFHIVHSMKGAAATMGFKQTVNALHAMENIIDSSYGNQIVIDQEVLHSFFDMVSTMKENLFTIERTGKEKNLSSIAKKFEEFDGKKRKETPDGHSEKKKKVILDALSTYTDLTIPSKKLSFMQNIIDDLAISVMGLKNQVSKSSDSVALNNAMQADKLVHDLRREFEKVRVVSLAQIFSSLPFLVKELANEEGKSVELVIEDNNISLDKSIADEIIEIVIQLIKNSVVHGIDKKQKNGKIVLEVNIDQENVMLNLSDNGQGINWEKIRSAAVEAGVWKKGKRISEEDKNTVIFLPGISTSEKLSIRSGRGVGLSLVKKKVDTLEGDINVNTSPKGTKFSIKFPRPLSIFKSIKFVEQNYEFSLPLSVIERIVQLPEIKDLSKDKTYSDKGQKYQLLKVGEIFKLPKMATLYKYIVLIKYNNKKVAIPIGSKISEEELIMKRTPQVLKKMDAFKGVAVSPSGKPVLILDLNHLI